MSKHTPGPWRVCDYGRVFLSVACDTRAEVARVSANDDAAIADANLLAAAPELLAALKRIMTKTFMDEHDPDVYRAAIAAIALAEGVQG